MAGGKTVPARSSEASTGEHDAYRTQPPSPWGYCEKRVVNPALTVSWAQGITLVKLGGLSIPRVAPLSFLRAHKGPAAGPSLGGPNGATAPQGPRRAWPAAPLAGLGRGTRASSVRVCTASLALREPGSRHAVRKRS